MARTSHKKSHVKLKAKRDVFLFLLSFKSCDILVVFSYYTFFVHLSFSCIILLVLLYYLFLIYLILFFFIHFYGWNGALFSNTFLISSSYFISIGFKWVYSSESSRSYSCFYIIPIIH